MVPTSSGRASDGAVEEVVDEGRLPHTRLAGDAHGDAAARAGGVEGVTEEPQVALASDERLLDVARVERGGRRAAGRPAEHVQDCVSGRSLGGLAP